MEERLFRMIREVCDTDIDITRETNLTFDLGLKSIDLLELITDVEDEFGVEVTDEAVETIRTVGDLLDYIESQK